MDDNNSNHKTPTALPSSSPLNGIQKPTPIQGVKTSSYDPPTNYAIPYSGGTHEDGNK
jgi:hypothetical protein